MCSILFEGGTYACAKYNPWSIRINNKHNKVVNLILRHKMHITACVAERIYVNRAHRLLKINY